jgi:hypothetical protein
MKLSHLLPAIALAFPLAGYAESEFSYDYLELSATHITAELKETDDELSANRYTFKFSKEFLFQLFARADMVYLNADNKVELEGDSVQIKQDSYGYNLHFGRYFELHNRVDALITLGHSRGHSTVDTKYSGANIIGEIKRKENDVDLSNSIDASLRIHLDSEKRFELSPAVRTRFDSDGTDTGLELGFGFNPMKNLQLVAAYLTEPGDLDYQTVSLGARWYY